MANLVLELKAGELLMINGATIRFRTRSRIELASRARFLFGKQIMVPHEATSPARQIYYALQVAYIGTEEERRTALTELQQRIAAFRGTTASSVVHGILDEMEGCALADECYAALKLGRRVILHEDSELRAGPESGG